MLKNTKVIMLVLPFIAFFTVTCAAAGDITGLNDLIENSIALNGHEVTVQGEVIGEPLERGNYAWVNISDTSNAIGIWVKKSDAERISFYGDYKHKGDTVRITGEFYKACSEHGGDVDIHCKNLKIMETGHDVKYGLSGAKVAASAVLTVGAAVTGTVYLKTLRKPRESRV